MKNVSLLFVLFLIAYPLLAQRQVTKINDGWKFGAGSNLSVVAQEYDDASWENITLPHTWNNMDGQDGGGNYVRDAFWYRKNINIENGWADKKVFLKFGAANIRTDVYINGNFVGDHLGGYAAFIFDVTEYLNFGEKNTIAVQVNNSDTIDAAPLSADFTFFGGITREVELIATNSVHISPLDYASNGVYLTPYSITENEAKVNAKIVLANYGATGDIKCITVIKDSKQITIDSVSTTVKVTGKTIAETELELIIDNPELWNGKINPNLYTATTLLYVNDELTDKVIESFGIRDFSVDKDMGFILNDELYRLQGVAMHEDRVDKGRAVSDEDRKTDLDMMNEMGCSYIRLAHYQHGQYTYDYCDSAGIILWTEIPLVNAVHNTTQFYNNAKSQMLELIKQNYNHPSVCFWGLCNEVNLRTTVDPTPLVSELKDLVKEIDTTRLTVLASMSDEKSTNWVPDLVSWNKYFGWYYGNMDKIADWVDNMRRNHPDAIIGVSEYGVGANPNHHETDAQKPLSSGQWHPEEYQNQYHETYWQAFVERPFLWSTSVWVAFDFASDGRNEGEQPGINDKGLVTRDRQIRKDSYYYYKANWSNEPFVHISSKRFDARGDSIVEVKIYSNCDSVKITINDSVYEAHTSDNNIFIWNKAILNEQFNNITATGYKNSIEYEDNCTWKYDEYLWSYNARDTLFPSEIQINFQPSSSTIPEGYLADVGLEFSPQDNGYVYGWSTSNTSGARDRGTSSNNLFNTFNHMQLDNTSKIWEIKVENNATYQVGIACGDPDYVDSYHIISIEGKIVSQGTHTYDNWIKYTDTVTVTDGLLTIRPAAGSQNAKINVVHISCLDCVMDKPTIINLSKEHERFSIYPNPSSDYIYITDLVGNANNLDIQIYDTSGRLLFSDYSDISDNIKVDISSLVPGAYIIRIKIDQSISRPYHFMKK